MSSLKSSTGRLPADKPGIAAERLQQVLTDLLRAQEELDGLGEATAAAHLDGVIEAVKFAVLSAKE